MTAPTHPHPVPAPAWPAGPHPVQERASRDAHQPPHRLAPWCQRPHPDPANPPADPADHALSRGPRTCGGGGGGC